MSEYRLGALHVVQSTHDKSWVDRKLRQLDERLFVELQLTFNDEQVWCVVEDTGEQHGAERFVVVYEHRDPAGKPIPVLTDAIVEEMQRRLRAKESNRPSAMAIVRRRNQERQERLDTESYEQAADIARDFEEHRRIGNFQMVPRSPGLARARARAESTRNEQLRAVSEAQQIQRALVRRGIRSRLVAA